jgi:hypothetical protein
VSRILDSYLANKSISVVADDEDKRVESDGKHVRTETVPTNVSFDNFFHVRCHDF